MKIVVLNGSPRKGGNTEIMTQAFAEAARKNQNEVSILDVAPMNIRGCLGCKYCWAHKGESSTSLTALSLMIMIVVERNFSSRPLRQ